MQIDQKTLQRLLSMNDRQLQEVIQKIAAEAGIDPTQLGLNPASITNIRQALGSATDQDLIQLNEVYQAYRQNKQS